MNVAKNEINAVMEELTLCEVEQVSGGVIPFILLGLGAFDLAIWSYNAYQIRRMIP